jgi:DUF917 family protein
MMKLGRRELEKVTGVTFLGSGGGGGSELGQILIRLIMEKLLLEGVKLSREMSELLDHQIH